MKNQADMKTTPSMKRPFCLPPQIAFIALVIGTLLHALSPISWRIIPAVPFIAILLLSVGAVLAVWAIAIFRNQRTPVYPTTTPTTLVTSGPFKFTRNPMYLGITSILIALVFLLGSLPMLVAPVLFLLVMNLYYLPFEEAKMEKLFGETYNDYRQRVRRWL
jgi:protein-S-isoprenylcysteine O-methyltransferase Ste14